VVLLVKGEGADASTTFTDESITGHTLTSIGGAQVDTAFSKYGSASMMFDGVDDLINGGLSDEFNFGNEDFTIELWTRNVGEPIGTSAWLSKWDNSISERQWLVLYDLGNNKIILYMSLDGVATLEASFDLDLDGIGVAGFWDGNWHHIACVRDGGVAKVYVDGILGGITYNLGTSAFRINTAVPMLIGARAVSPGYHQWMDCHMDEIRITKGHARYTAPFTPPTEEFPTIVDPLATLDFEDTIRVSTNGAWAAQQNVYVITGPVANGATAIEQNIYVILTGDP
jgi:hypothetical protein